MKKLINWIWSKKQEEVEVFEAKPYRMIDEKSENSTPTTDCHQISQWGDNLKRLLEKLFKKKQPKPEPFFEWVETPEEKQERLKQKYN